MALNYLRFYMSPSNLDIAENFCDYLYKNDYILEKTITKETARKVYNEKFRPGTSNNMHFHILLMLLIELRLIKKQRQDLNILHFDKKRRKQLMSELDSSHSKGQTSQNQKRKEKEILEPLKTKFVSQRVTSSLRQEKDNNYITDQKCMLCDCHFKTFEDYEKHLSNTLHILRKKYCTSRKELINCSADIVIEVNNGHGSEKEEVIARIADSSSKLLITNKSQDTYVINEIYLLHRDTSGISLKYQLPIKLKRNTQHILHIDLSFKNEGAYILPILFKADNKITNKSTHILKELIFRAQSVMIDNLKPTAPYKKINKPVIEIEEIPLIPGKPLPSFKRDLIYELKLDTYKIPHNIIKIINSGFKKYRGMTTEDEAQLKKIMKLLNSSNRSNSLTQENYCELLELLLYIEEHQMLNDIHFYDCEKQTLKTVPGKKLLSLNVPGLLENRPSLIRGDKVHVTLPGNCKFHFEGIAHFIRETDVWLGFHNSFTKKHTPTNLYNISFTFNRYPLRTEHQAVKLVNKHGISSFIFPKTIAPHNNLSKIQLNWCNKFIVNNKQQQQAVHHILSRTSYPAPYVVFGPPGTGKTMTIVEAILQIWKTQPDCNILVSAPSNSAANEITLRLTKFIKSKTEIFRILSLSNSLNNIPDEIKKFCNIENENNYLPSLETIMSYRIVVVTLCTAARLVNGGIPYGHFKYVFIDESGHSTESETLIAIAGILSNIKYKGQLSGQVVLAGDPKQLGPIIHSNIATEFGFGISMLERLMNTCDIYKKDPKTKNYNSNCVTKLLKNYRSHPVLLEIPNDLFYDNELIPCADAMSNVALNWEFLPNKKFPVIFHTVIGMEEKEENSPSYFNRQEIDVIVNTYLLHLIGTRLNGMKIKESHIGIITPYRKQVQKITIACKKTGWNKILIGSVEQFQGQEKLITFISTVRSRQGLVDHENKFNLGFLKNPKRFNVAITRAKALVIIVGNPLILQSDKYWAKFLEFCQNNNAFAGPKFQFEKHYDKEDIPVEFSKLKIEGTDPDHPDFSRGLV